MQSIHQLLGQYIYDALDRLVHQHQPAAPVSQRFYCKSRLATEIHGALKHSILQHGDLLLAEQRREGSSSDTTLLTTDLQRSVLNTLKQDAAPQPIAYSPYGHRPAPDGLLSLLGFNGEHPDPLTGHYLLGNGYRAFNPVLMRFNSPDSLSPFGKGGLNPYSYCLGDPIGHTDPTGHFRVPKPLAKLIGMKSTRAPSFGPVERDLVTKLGYTKKAGIKASKKIGNLEREADKLTSNARAELLSKDTKLAFKFHTPYKEPAGTLGEKAYNVYRSKTSRTGSTVFDFLDSTTLNPEESAYLTIELFAQNEIAQFRPLLNKLNKPHSLAPNRLSNLDIFFDPDELTSSYIKRLASISPPEAEALREKALKIRHRTFK